MNEPENPYASPAESHPADQIEVRPSLKRAGQGARLANFIIDYLAQSVLGFVIGMAIALIGGQQGIDFLEGTPGVMIGIPILLAYYFIMEATTSRTLGKLVTGTMVVNEDGGIPSVGQIAGRTLCRMIPFEPLSFFGTPTRGWHDSIPKTFVVKSR